MVPLNAFSDWRKLKDFWGGQLEKDLWATMQTRFVLDPNTRAQVISDIGLKWRTFKTTLTTKYILPFKDDLELLVAPPTKYKYLDIMVWTAFVQSRLTPEFQERVRVLEHIVKEKETNNSHHSENVASNSSGISRGRQFEDGGTSKVDKAVSNIEFSIPQDVVDDSSVANGEVASQLQKFGKIIEKMMKSSQISIPLEKGVFEEEIAFNYFLKSDLLDVCNMKKLEVNSMTAYLRFLYDRFESSRAKYGFFHPSHFNDFGDREEMKCNLIKRMKVALGYPWGYTVKLYVVKAVRRDTDLIKVTSLLEQCSSQGVKGNLIYVIDVSGHALSSPAFGWAMRYVGSLVRTEARKALVGELE
ncbi:hypothetical protein IFM89_019252 [Coptis chinensis]|uniref:Transposase n=1 Tax=Coptis chinensis TaxID=261450 RepID=A0A835HN31_9MAGN|nr:hypothetical protein IFM89_019252 [Coptis chinensis]